MINLSFSFSVKSTRLTISYYHWQSAISVFFCTLWKPSLAISVGCRPILFDCSLTRIGSSCYRFRQRKHSSLLLSLSAMYMWANYELVCGVICHDCPELPGQLLFIRSQIKGINIGVFRPSPIPCCCGTLNDQTSPWRVFSTTRSLVPPQTPVNGHTRSTG